MFKLKKRHKPLYKKFIKLRVNAQYRRKLLLLKFKKQKWQQLILFLKRLQNRRKKNFRLYDLSRSHLPKHFNSFKRKYKLLLDNKKKFSLFYGGLRTNCIKKQVKLVLKSKKQTLNQLINSNNFLIGLMEQRLDSILYRSHFASSMRNAQQLILHKHISINEMIITNGSCIVKQGDIIQVNEKIKPYILKNIKSSHLWPIAPKYLQINYKTLQILMTENIKFQKFSSSFPFWPNIYLLLQMYR